MTQMIITARCVKNLYSDIISARVGLPPTGLAERDVGEGVSGSAWVFKECGREGVGGRDSCMS